MSLISQKKHLTLLLSISLLSACAAPIGVNMPVGRMHSPEALGKNSFQGSGGLQGADEVVLTTDLVQRLPNTVDPAISRDLLLRFGAGAGALPWLDLDLFLPLRFQVKAQLIGKNRQEAVKGNFSVALTAAAGRGFERGSGNDTWQIFHTRPLSETKSDFEMKSVNYDTSLILGWRFADAFMLYGGPFLSTYRYYGGYTQRNTSGGITSTGRFAGLARQRGLHLGMDWGNKNFSLRGEGGISQSNSGLTQILHKYFSFMLTAYFGQKT